MIYFHRVCATEAGGAVVIWRMLHAGQHALDRQIMQRVYTQVFADLLDGAFVGDEFSGVREIDAEVTRAANRRAGYAEMDLGRPGLTQRPDLTTCGRSTNDRIFHDDEPPALDVILNDVQLHLNG